MRILYIEPFFGASGDMLLSCFVSLGMPEEYLYNELKKISPIDFKMDTKSVISHGVSAKRIKFKFRKEHKFRNLDNIKQIFLNSKCDAFIKNNSINVLEKLALVESKVHGIDLEKVHFHELGAIDTILDIAGFFICLNYFKIDRIFYGTIHLGKGFFHSAHGFMPVPAYATMEFLKGKIVKGIPVEYENITPTAIALMTTFGEQSDFPEMKIINVGYSCGFMNFGNYPNLLRMTIGEKDEKVDGLLDDVVCIAEFQVDDMSPELIGYFYERAFESNAIDLYITPIFMKKNRPGTLITILFKEEDMNKIVDAIFKETTTLGFRLKKERRILLSRNEKTINTKYGKIQIKESRFGDKIYIKPDFDSLKRIAKKLNVPLKELYEIVVQEIKK